MPDIAPAPADTIGADPHRSAEDAQLLAQFVSGSASVAEAAFEELLARHSVMVERVCRRLLGDDHDAEDAAQAVFLILARKAGRIRKRASLASWLHGTALRVARKLRSEIARVRALERNKAGTMRTQADSYETLTPEDFSDLHEAIDRLPEKYREPIVLFHLRGLSQTETAAELRLPLGTVQARLHRGKEKLRDRLARTGAGLAALAVMTLSRGTAGAATLARRQATARAAVRFASGGSTQGLVAPAVAKLASGVLESMLKETIVSLTPAASLVLCALAIAWFAAPLLIAQPKAHAVTNTLEPAPAPAPAEPAREPGRTIASVAVRDDDPLDPGIAPENDAAPARTNPAAPARKAGRAASPTRPAADRKPTGARGKELFEHVWVKNDALSPNGDGLGPVYNGRSCLECHSQGGTGGGGSGDRNIDVASVFEPNMNAQGYFYSFNMDFGAGKMEYRMGFDPKARSASKPVSSADSGFLAAIHPGFRNSPSVVLHRFGVDPSYNAWRSNTPGVHGGVRVDVTERNPPPLFGLGLIDAIPDEVIEAGAKKRSAGSAVRGRVSRLRDGRVGKFGWKAQTATLEEFVLSAAAGEIGLEVPEHHQAADPRFPGAASPGLDLTQDDCAELVAFVRDLPRPEAADPEDESERSRLKAGESTFKAIGCSGCHVPNLGKVNGIYSDLLLHDVSPPNSEGAGYVVFTGAPQVRNERRERASEAASPREWRTPPLWGLSESAPYMHDGRASNVAEAITAHAGQGAASARRFADLPGARKRRLLDFLMSLKTPEAQR